MTTIEITKAMTDVRHSLHQCNINNATAMYRLMVLGLSPVNADRFLRCLPLREIVLTWTSCWTGVQAVHNGAKATLGQVSLEPTNWWWMIEKNGQKICSGQEPSRAAAMEAVTKVMKEIV